MSKCIGCGITLQNTFKDDLGYTKELCNLYCERCFRTIHYNEEKIINNKDNSLIINKINKMKCFTLFITDILSINNNLIDVFNSITNKKVLIINKCDLLPKNFNLNHIKENIKNSYNIDNDIFFISAKKNIFLNDIINIIKNNKKVILCGETSGGKSTLINSLIGSKLTTSKYNNTTLEFIKLKYEDYILYDTPGIIINNNKKSIDKIVLLQKQMNSDYTLFIDNLRINGNGNFTIIGSNILKISSKKDNSKLDYFYKIDDNSDIVLDNGFIYLKKGIDIYTNMKIEIRKSIIGR